MMFYAEKFKGVFIATLKGLGIGAVISFILSMLLKPYDTMQLILMTLAFTILIGPFVSIILCEVFKVEGFISSAIGNLLSGIEYAFIGGSFFSVIGVVKIAIGLFILIPVCIFMVISYIFNFIYLGIMCLFEKCKILNNKEGLCSALDKCVVVLAGIVTAFLFISVLKQI